MDTQDSIMLYLRDCSAKGLRMLTQKSYAHDLNQFVTTLELTKTSDITYDSIRNFLSSLRESNYKDVTVDKYRRVLSAWIKWLYQEGYADLPGMTDRVKRVKMDKPTPRFITPDDIRRFLEAAETVPHSSQFAKLRDIAMLHVMCDTGLRRGEITAMQMDGLDLHKRTIRIMSTCKGRRERSVMFTPETLRRLRGYMQKRVVDSNYVWLTDKGEPAQTTVIRHAIKRAAIAAGLPGLNPRALRHSFGTKAIKSGIPVTSVQKLMGHSDVSTTMIYVHILNDDALEDYEKYFI